MIFEPHNQQRKGIFLLPDNYTTEEELKTAELTLRGTGRFIIYNPASQNDVSNPLLVHLATLIEGIAYAIKPPKNEKLEVKHIPVFGILKLDNKLRLKKVPLSQESARLSAIASIKGIPYLPPLSREILLAVANILEIPHETTMQKLLTYATPVSSDAIPANKTTKKKSHKKK